jgi:hypothetical protein
MVFNYDYAVSDKIADGCGLFQTMARRCQAAGEFDREEMKGAEI